MSNDDLKQFLGTETVYCEICNKSIEIPKGSLTIPRFCLRCFHEKPFTGLWK